MGFLSGLGNLFGIGGAGTAAKNASKNAKWLPPSLNINGAVANFDKGNIKKNIPGSASVSLNPQQQAFYDSLQGLATNAIGRLSSSGGAPAVPGYAGVTPELYNEFNLSNMYGQDPYGSVGNIYQPNISNLGQIRGATYDGSGMPNVRGVTYDGSGMPTVAGGFDPSGMPQAGGNVSWGGKAESLDQNYLDKSKAFLDASNPVTGFDGLATDWYNSLRQLSADDQNNMLAGAGDKQFLRGMLGQETGQGYNPAMKAAFSAYNDQDLKDKLAGYQVGADASQRNLQQALAAGGFVQQNDQTRLQQAIAQGQIDAQTSMANAGNWLTGQGMGIQARGMDASNWLQNQGLGLQAQGMNQNADQANLSGWLSGQGLNLQAQGMNQNADAQNIANYLQGQGMMTDASSAQASRDLAANAQTLNQNQFNFDRANARFANAQNMFGMGQNTLNAEQQRLMQLLGAGGGGMQNYDQYLMNMLGLQGNLGAAQSGANAAAGNMMNQYNLAGQGMWANMLGSAMGAGAEFDPRKWG